MLYSILATLGVGVLAFVSIFLGGLIGSAINFRNFGSSGFALIGTALAFIFCITLVTMGGVLVYVGVSLSALLYGVMMRQAAF